MRSGTGPEHGFGLLEAVAAIGLLAVCAAGVAQLVAASATVQRHAGDQSIAMALAVSKLEALRALTWRFDEPAPGVWVRTSDVTTDTSLDPPAGGGLGLLPSPAGSLDADVPGYVEYLGADGRLLGRVPPAPAGTAFVRRWSVVPLAIDPIDSRAIEVRVAPARAGPVLVAGRPGADEVWLSVVITRWAR